jgi:hypothetical protein
MMQSVWRFLDESVSPLLPRWAWILLIACSIFFLGYVCLCVRKQKLFYIHNDLNSYIVTSLPFLRARFWPTPYLAHPVSSCSLSCFFFFFFFFFFFLLLLFHVLFSQILQSWFANVFRKKPADVNFSREVLKMYDGELIALDWYNLQPKLSELPTVIILHGISGISARASFLCSSFLYSFPFLPFAQATAKNPTF